MPSWLKKRITDTAEAKELGRYLRENAIETVCRNSKCPNIGECYSVRNVSFLILGNICTRRCSFCAIWDGKPDKVKPDEPSLIAKAVSEINLKYVVITSATRDDILDGGSGHYADVVRAIKAVSPETIVETLTPDFNGSESSIEKIIEAGVDIFSHNMDTVARLCSQIKPDFDYFRSLDVLRYASSLKKATIKSGFMVGLGEEEDEVEQLLGDIKSTGCILLTIGQYLRPKGTQLEVKRYVPPKDFEDLKEKALKFGFKKVSSGPFVRSSYKAGELFADDQLQIQKVLK
jgi:lipoic acid synthetase